MVKSQTKRTDKNRSSETKEIKRSGKIRKPKPRKKKSIHANTFEERQENRRRKQEIADQKQQNKDRRVKVRSYTKGLINEVSSWAKDNPLHPSIIPHPTQEGVAPLHPVLKGQKTYKAFIKNLSPLVTAQEIDEHFYNRKGVQIHTIRLFCHRKTGACLGWGFLEFKNKLEFEKSLAFNFSLFQGRRIIVQQSLRTFVPSKNTPQKVEEYKVPKKTEKPKFEVQNEIIEDKEYVDDDDIQLIENKGQNTEIENEGQNTEIENEGQNTEIENEGQNTEIENEGQNTEIENEDQTIEIENEDQTIEIENEDQTTEMDIE